MSMTPKQAGIIEPILTTQARGYSNAEFIGTRLLPIASVRTRNAKVLKFVKNSFRKRNTRRAPGSETMRIETSFGADPIALYQESLEGLVPTETEAEAKAIPGIDMGVEAVREVQDVIQLGRECQIAELVRNQANYDAGHVEVVGTTDKWSDPASNPLSMLNDARSVIRRKTGRKPNTLTINDDTAMDLCSHPSVLDHYKHTTGDSVTVEMLARYLKIKEILVGEAVFLPENAPDEAEATDVWGDDAILSYKPEGTNYRVPSFGYTYQLEGFPMAEVPYYERNRKSWVYPYTEEYRPYINGADAGFLFKGVR